MLDRKTWDTWSETSAAVDVALGLALLADYDCANSIASAAEKDTASRALSSAICGLLKKSAALLQEIEPKSTAVQV